MDNRKDSPCFVCQRERGDDIHCQVMGPEHVIIRHRDHNYIQFPTNVDHCGNCGHRIHDGKCEFAGIFPGIFPGIFVCKCEQCILVKAIPNFVPVTDGGPAYPPNDFSSAIGLTKREWYKGMIIQGMNASPELMEAVTKVNLNSAEGLRMMGMLVFERMAEKAGEQADAMIAEDRAFREKNENPNAF